MQAEQADTFGPIRPSSAPALHRISAPPPPSSAGCHRNFTHTGSSRSIDFSAAAVPINVAV